MTADFREPIARSLPLLLAHCLTFIIAALAIGLPISTLAWMHLEAVQFAMLIMLPSFLLSALIPFGLLRGRAGFEPDAVPQTDRLTRPSRDLFASLYKWRGARHLEHDFLARP